MIAEVMRSNFVDGPPLIVRHSEACYQVMLGHFIVASFSREFAGDLVAMRRALVIYEQEYEKLNKFPKSGPQPNG